MPTPPPDPLDDLRERLAATREAAERLAGQVPRQGWASGSPPGDDAEATAREVQAIVALLGSLRELVPPELWEQLREVLRQVLLLVRAILDHLVERLEADRVRDQRHDSLEDIPIG